MNKLLALLLIMLAPAALHAAEPQPFERGTWNKINQAHAGKPTVIHFWGLTCAPCLVEMPEWGKLAAARPDMNLVLIAADPAPQRLEQAEATLDRAGLAKAESWTFADRFIERLRYEIDPAWAGELPRTVLIDRDGQHTVLAGVADLTRVRAWLDAQARPAASTADYKLGSIEISNPWTRATPASAPTGGGFLKITNTGATADRLVSAKSAAARNVEVHEMKMDGNVMRMRAVEGGLDIPAGGSVVLRPGGYHLMMMGLAAPFKKDSRIPVTLTFEKAGSIDIELRVEAMGAMPADHH